MIKKSDLIVTAFCQPASGPGWSNCPLWVIVKRDGVLIEECIQPNEQSELMMHLYKLSSAIQTEMMFAIESWRDKKRKN